MSVKIEQLEDTSANNNIFILEGVAKVMIGTLAADSSNPTPNRKHLSRNYAQMLVEELESAPFLQQGGVAQLKAILKSVECIPDLASAFVKCPDFILFLEPFSIVTGSLLSRIFNTDKISVQEKLAMLESYGQFVWGVKHPTQFVSFTDENKFEKLSHLTRLANRCRQLPYSEILAQTLQIASPLLEKNPPTSQHTKHITQLWLNRIKECLTAPSLTSFLAKHIDDYPVRDIVDRLKTSRKVRLQAFKDFLGLPEISEYVRDNLIKDNKILRDILKDVRMDVRTKVTLIQKYPIFLRACEDPESLRNWRNKKYLSA